MSAPQDVRDRALKIAARELVAQVGGQESAAQLIGKSQSQVQRCCSLNDEGSFLTVRDVAVLEQYAPRAAVTGELAKQAGGVFLALPDPALDDEDLAMKIMNIADELGDVSHVVRDALRDGRIDRGEAAQTESELDQLLDVVLAARAHVQAIQGKPASVPVVREVGFREVGGGDA